MRLAHIALLVPLASAIAGAAACSGGAPASPTFSSPDASAASSVGPAIPFSPDSPYAYVAKVKNVLIGLPPTDAEVKGVIAASDPEAQLQTLIKGWMALKDPNNAEGATYYAEKMLVFFKLATQQTQINISDFMNQSPHADTIVPGNSNLFLQNATESFARTMVDQLVNGTAPTTKAVTTTSFMMTTALMEVYAYLDAVQVNDSGSTVDNLAKANPTLSFTLTSESIPVSESVDPTSANFMHWTDPDVAAGAGYASVKNIPAGCATNPLVYSPSTSLSTMLHYFLYGTITSRTLTGNVNCPQYGGTAAAAAIGNAANGGANDYSDWREVTIRQPMAGESTTAFYDVPTLRQASTLVLNLPRVGFFTTPAFFANWQTNTSNTMRVTMNQTLIVSLGSMVDGLDPTIPKLGDGGLPPGLDATHATPGTACYSCHQLLDPTRSILAATYSWNYHAQDTAAFSAQPGEFAFQGVIAYPETVYDLATILSTHPLFAQGWVQKLCYYANSQACETTDPEFQRIVKDFQSSGYSWNELVLDLFSSPLTTDAKPTQTTTDDGAIVAVSRRDHFCAALNFRLGFSDICALLPTTVPVSSTIAQIAGGLPSDGYGRGSTAPVLPNMPSLFYRAGTENICGAVAQLVIDPKNPPANLTTWSSASPASVTQAISDFAQTIMGLVPSDPRFAQAEALLAAQYAASLAAVDPTTSKNDFTPTEALESTFVAACLAPSAVSIGM
jgi:hypothetical protein